MNEISHDDFTKIEIRAGTVLTARENPKAKKPAYILTVDFGHLGIKTSSAQITQNHSVLDIIGKQIVAVINFPPKRVAGVKSEVLILAAASETRGIVLLETSHPVEDGCEIA